MEKIILVEINPHVHFYDGGTMYANWDLWNSWPEQAD